MKNVKLVFIFSFVFNVSVFAQPNIKIADDNTQYSYSSDSYRMEGLTVDNLSLNSVVVTSCEILDYESYFEDGSYNFPMSEGQVAVFLEANGNFVVNNRSKVFPSTISAVGNANAPVFGSYELPVNKSESDLSSEGKSISKFTENDISYYVVNGDDEKYYWAIYHLVKQYENNGGEYHFERGNEILEAFTDASGCQKNDNLFYLVEESDGVKTYYPVVFDFVEGGGSDFSFSLNNCKEIYEVTSISKTNILSGSLSSVTIGSSIRTIASDAFANCKIGQFIVNDNSKYSTIGSELSDNGKVLCRNENGDPVEVLAVSYDNNLNSSSNKIELPASVNKIADNALAHKVDDYNMFYNISGAVWFYTPIYITYNGPKYQLGHENDPDSTKELKAVKDQYKIVHFDHPAVNYNNVEIPNGIQSYVQLSGKGTQRAYSLIAVGGEDAIVTPGDLQTAFNGMGSYDGLCYIDLTKCTLAPEGTNFNNLVVSGINENCLVFLPVGATSTATNVICKQSNGTYTCNSLSLTRANAKPFYTPYAFTANNATVDYAIGSNLVGLVLPFDYENENVNFATFNNVTVNTESGTGTVNLNIVDAVSANTPFIAQLKSEKTSSNISAQNVTVQPSVVDVPTVSNGWTLSGSYRTVTNSGVGTIYGFASNKLMKANGATFKPFSAFFVQGVGATNASLRSTSLSDIATGIEDVNSDESYVVAGEGAIILNGVNKKVSVVSVNGYSLFNGVVNGSKTIDVKPGVYVVNGKKVVVNN